MTDSENKKTLTISSNKLTIARKDNSQISFVQGSKTKSSGVHVEVRKKRNISSSNVNLYSLNKDNNYQRNETNAKLEILKKAAAEEKMRKAEQEDLEKKIIQKKAEHVSILEDQNEKIELREEEEEFHLDTETEAESNKTEAIEDDGSKIAGSSVKVDSELIDEEDDELKKNKKKTKAELKPKVEERRAPNNKTLLSKALYEDEEVEENFSYVRPSFHIRKRKNKKNNKVRDLTAPPKIKRQVIVPDVITVKELADRMAERSADVVKELMKLGMIVTLNQNIDHDTAELIVTTFGHEMKKISESEIEDILIPEERKPEDYKKRPPVVTIMGHVDHGKTSLLDAIRSSNVADKEAGGITQHIGAYQINHNGEVITFLDTPGHAAFSAMRSRGAKVTDIVVLVVAADDGVKPQTVEAINHAKAANVPIIVAINKIDKHGADPQKVKEELLSYELVSEDFGGDVMMVGISALKRTNLDGLLDVILLLSEMMALKAIHDGKAYGVVIESKVDKARGVVASLIVERGCLKKGDIVVAGTNFGKVRYIENDQGKPIDSAGPSMPVEILGLDEAPVAGDSFGVVDSEKQARDIIEYRNGKILAKRFNVENKNSIEDLLSYASGSTKIKVLSIIIKADVHGSSEAIEASLAKIQGHEISLKVLHNAVGSINESDVMLANSSKAIIIGFNVRANNAAKLLADKSGVEIRYYSIIYNLIDDIKDIARGMLSPIIRENSLGTVEIRQVFNITKVGKIGGAFVTSGIIKNNSKIRIIRDGVVIHEDKMKSLRRFKDEVKEVREGQECGVALDNYTDIKEGDVLEVFEITQEKRDLN